MTQQSFLFSKTSHTFRAFRLFDLPADALARIRAVKFDLEAAEPGFHDCGPEGDGLAGYFSNPEAFEVEHLKEGTVTKTQMRRLKYAAWWMAEGLLVMTGDGAAVKMAHAEMTAALGFCPSPVLFDTMALLDFADRLALSAVSGRNAKGSPVRSIKVAGKIEETHIATTIESIKGEWDSPIGPVTITAKKDGALTLKKRAGYDLDLGALRAIVRMVAGMVPEPLPKDAGDLFDQAAGQTSVEIEIDGVRAKFASPEEMAAKLKAAVRKAGGPA